MTGAPLDGGPGRVRALVRFARGGPGRYLSHLDTARALQRTFARAGVSLALSEGMRPRPRLAVGLPLPVGAAASDELAVVDIAVGERRPSEPVGKENGAQTGMWRTMLQAATPPGIAILDVERCPAGLRLRPELAVYEWSLTVPLEAIAGAVRRVLAREEAIVERRSPKGVREVDVRETVSDSLVLPEDGGCVLRFAIRYRVDGAVRPAEVLQAVLNEVTPVGLADEATHEARLTRRGVMYRGLAVSGLLKEWLENHDTKKEEPGRD